MLAILATGTTTSGISLDGTITISIVLAICALFAPSITAIINNKHQYKMRKLELSHDEYLHHSDMQYRNKYDVYKSFIETAGDYCMFNDLAKYYTNFLSALQAALLLCDAQTRPLLLEFQKLTENYSSRNKIEYVKLLTSITDSFNRELSLLSSRNDN